jgi:excisionase family DNA binding protein
MEVERLLLRPAEVAAMCGFSRAKAYDLIGKGILPSVRLGKSVRVPAAALRKLIDAAVGGDAGGGATE